MSAISRAMNFRPSPVNGACHCISNRRRPAPARNTCLISGFTPEVLLRNFELLDLDPGHIDGLILSHGHRDHYGGLEGFVAHHRAQMPSSVKLFTGGDSAFAEKWIKRRNAEPVSWGKLDRRGARGRAGRHGLLRAARGARRPVYDRSDRPHLVRADFGQHPGRTRSRCARPFHRSGAAWPARARPAFGRTCDVLCRPGTRARRHFVMRPCRADQLDQGGDGGIRGRQIARRAGRVPPRPGADGLCRTYGRRIESLSPDVVVPMHCSGAKFIAAMQREMPDRLVTTNIGTRFTFGV